MMHPAFVSGGAPFTETPRPEWLSQSAQKQSDRPQPGFDEASAYQCLYLHDRIGHAPPNSRFCLDFFNYFQNLFRNCLMIFRTCFGLILLLSEFASDLILSLPGMRLESGLQEASIHFMALELPDLKRVQEPQTSSHSEGGHAINAVTKSSR